MNEASSVNPLDREEKATDIVTLRQLLSGNHVFRIPDYQRGYAWNNEFIVMWQDILRLYRTSNRKHYTGMLALEEIIDESIKENEAITGATAFYIVDGQQRITSLIIIISSLIAYICDELPDQDRATYDILLSNDTIYRLGYSVKRSNEEAKYFEERIYNNSTGQSHADKYLSNIDAAKVYIDKELNRVSGETAKEILDTILDRIVFNLYFVTEDFDVRVTFETINNRGKRLSKLELLKNRLMYLTTFFPQHDSKGSQLKNAINTNWQIIYKNLCFGDEQLSDDDYLKAHWIVYKRLNKRKGDAYIDDLLNEEFSIDSGTFYRFIAEENYSNAYKHIKDYVDSLSKYSIFWAFVNKPNEVTIDIPVEEANWIKRLNRISTSMYLRAALMVIMSEKSLVTADKIKFYSKAELFIFVNKLLAQDSNDLSFMVTYGNRLLAKSENKAQTIKDIIIEIDNHELHVDARRVKIAIEAFKTNVLDKKADYYYAWNGLRYFLYEYNDSIKIQNAAPIQWYQLNNTSIEHVLPQTPTTEYWLTAFSNYNADEMRVITNSLGNLLLLSCGAENSSLRNYSFPVKKDMSVGSGKFAYTQGSRSAREIAENDCWTINEVAQRSNNLIQFMYNHWFASLGISEQDWNECVSILRNNLPEILKDQEYSQIKTTLSAIDTSDERTQANDAVKPKKTDYLQQQFLAYIDTDLMPIKYNATKIYFKDWFTFKILSPDGEPDRLECGVKANDRDYRVKYFYASNEVDVSIWDVQKKKWFWLDISELPDKLKPFILSLYRYIRKEFGKPQPLWIKSHT